METHFDVLILGTGLTQSITAAALAKAGLRVLHVDENPYYGGDQASLSHDELLKWSQSPPSSVSGVSLSSSLPLPFSRSYTLSLAPALIPSSGPLIASLILSGVSRYSQFKLLDAVYIFRHNSLHRVPGNKEDIFTAHEISLVDKRKLMRFLQFAAGEFEGVSELQGHDVVPFSEILRDKFLLEDDHVEAILYALAYCSSPTDQTLPALLRLRQYLRAAGRYGNSPFLVGHYGGLGEISQGFCRTCAVNGGIYILGHKILTLHFPYGSLAESSEARPASIRLEDVPDILTADFVIAAPDHMPSSGPSQPGSAYACCVAITDKPLSTTALPIEPEGEVDEEKSNGPPHPDTAVAVFPPGSLPGGNAPNAVHVLQMGEATLSCPKDKYILYLCTRADDDPATILRPYLVAVTNQNEDGAEGTRIEFSLFYTRHNRTTPSSQLPRTLVVPGLQECLPEIGDQATRDAEALFWDTLKVLTHKLNKVEAFWPPLDSEDENGVEDW